MDHAKNAIVERLMEGDLFEAIGMGHLPHEQKEGLLHSMCQTVYARVFQRIAQTLDEEEVRFFMDLPVHEIDGFLSQREFDLAAAVIEESARYRMEVILVYRSAQLPSAPVPAANPA